MDLSERERRAWAEVDRLRATTVDRDHFQAKVQEWIALYDEEQAKRRAAESVWADHFGTAMRLLNDARTTIIDTDLRREWEAERARLRAVVARPSADSGAVSGDALDRLCFAVDDYLCRMHGVISSHGCSREEAATMLEAAFPTNRVDCPTCGGDGKADYVPGASVRPDCDDCGGTGKVEVVRASTLRGAV